MYLIFDWSTVKCIIDPNIANIGEVQAFTIPNFNEKLFPFIIVVGEVQISLLNIATLEYEPLAIGKSNALSGVQSAFAIGDMSKIQLHCVLEVQDKEGTGK